MGTPTQAPPARRHFLVEIWEENREAFKALIADALLFLTALAVLFAVFLALRLMGRAGYPSERIARFETIHYWAYYIVLVIFLVDLVMKLIVFFFPKRKP